MEPVEQHFFGTAVSRGIALGRAVLLNGTDSIDTDRTSISQEAVAGEVIRFRIGYRKVHDELTSLASSDKSGILDVHLLILEDAFGSGMEQVITERGITAEACVRSRVRELASRQRSVSDKHIREKYLDIYDVGERLIRALTNTAEPAPNEPGSIYIVSQLTPSRLVEMAAHHPRGIISEHGGWTSHTSILAREYRVPAVTGVTELESVVADGDLLLIDGFAGKVILHPSPETISSVTPFTSASVIVPSHDASGAVETVDGIEVTVRVNANLPEIYDRARRAGAEGIGLYRSEVLFDRKNAFPTEQDQYEAYSEIAAATGTAGVRIRTFDIGIDRLPNDRHHHQLNPSLGLRAVRFSLTEPSYFRTQIRAILRAAYERNVDLILPMISGVEDVVRLRRMIEEERTSLESSETPIGTPRIGVMIETPAAVMTAASIATQVDLFCLGTNDLVQYLLAVDRDEPAVAGWYQTLHPAVTTAIRSVVDVAEKTGVPITVCGEMAASPYYVPLLLGLGARELSINVNSIAVVRSIISDLNVAKCSELAAQIMQQVTAPEAENALRRFYESNWPFILSTAG